MSKIHFLKIDDQEVEALILGIKTFEIRKDGGDYKENDQIVFAHLDGSKRTELPRYTVGLALNFKDGIKENVSVFAILPQAVERVPVDPLADMREDLLNHLGRLADIDEDNLELAELIKKIQ